MRGARAVAVAAAVVAACGCARCSRGAPPAPERFLPGSASWALLVPRLRTAQEQAAPLLRTVASFPAAADASESLAAVRGQLGFDPLDPGALAGAGLDAEGGAGVAQPAAGPPVVALPTLDADRLDATLARLARDLLGAPPREARDVDGVRVTVFRRAP